MPAPRREFVLVLLAGAAGSGLVVLAVRQAWAHALFTPPRPLPAQDITVTRQQLVPLPGALAPAGPAAPARGPGADSGARWAAVSRDVDPTVGDPSRTEGRAGPGPAGRARARGRRDGGSLPAPGRARGPAGDHAGGGAGRADRRAGRRGRARPDHARPGPQAHPPRAADPGHLPDGGLPGPPAPRPRPPRRDDRPPPPARPAAPPPPARGPGPGPARPA